MSFKLNVLNEDVPSEYDMGTLLTRKKRGRPKSVPSALHVVKHEDSSDSDVSNKHEKSEEHPAVPHAIQIYQRF